jgi:hypothetical protein|tara:strand:- start:62 stop:466 length:405 start_codon:yes stop_codon:yes gene_type:complete
MISNPLQIKEIPTVDIHKMERNDTRDEILPMVNRNYDRQLYSPYAAQRNGYYYVNPYYYNRYNTYRVYDVYDISQPSVSQNANTFTPVQQSPKIEIKETPSAKDVERARAVWQKRIDPRIRKSPKPTRRKKDEE